jgi:hypothetical protein
MRRRLKPSKPTVTMTKTILSLAVAALTTVAFAKDKVVTSTATTTDSTIGTGTITEYSPGKTFIVKETSGPVTYRYGKEVHYVTKKGTRLSEDEVRTRVKVGAPVHVHYTTEGSDRVISSVELDD